MIFDVKVPEKLKCTQFWFASIIGRPIDLNSQMNPISPSGRPMKEEAKDYISPSPTLQSDQRIQIYNQQFWWRLLNTLHDAFPLVTRLFGYQEFNEKIGVPYIEKYLPNHWSLSYLGNRLAQWVEEEYDHEDKSLVRIAVRLDYAYNESFIAAHLCPMGASALSRQADISELLSKTAYLQPHLHLFALDYDLFSFRDVFLEEEPDYWLTHNFPEIKKEKPYHVVLFRDVNNNVVSDQLTSGEFRVLERFQKGSTIEEAIQWLEKQDKELQRETAEDLHNWVKKWMIKQWLTLEKKEES